MLRFFWFSFQLVSSSKSSKINACTSANFWIIQFMVFYSSILLMEEKVSKTHRSSIDWALWIWQNFIIFTIVAQCGSWNVHINLGEYWWLSGWRQWKSASDYWHPGKRAIAWSILWSIQKISEGNRLCNWQRNSTEVHTWCSRVWTCI